MKNDRLVSIIEVIVMTVDSSKTSRRTLLRRIGVVGGTAASASLSGCISLFFGGSREKIRQRRRPGKPISFASQRKRIRKKDATVVVHNRSELLAAIKTSDAVVWIPGDVTIDLTDYFNIRIAPNVTIASNRNLKKGNGARIQSNDYDHLFYVPEQGARLTGLQLRGPQTQYRDFPTKTETYANAAFGIWFQDQYGIVDNCEMWGWSGYATGAGLKNTPTQMWIHHNDMHHNHMGGLGYALESLNGFSLVEWNYFSGYRHVVSGYGYKTNGYEFRFNVVGPPNNSDPARFPCDMHSLGEQPNYPPSNNQAGKYINVHHNVFELAKENAMSISGIPTKYARFVNNWTAHSKGGDGPGEPAVYAPSGATVKKHNNHFGRKVVKAGRQWLKKMNTEIPISSGKPSPSDWSPSQNRKKNKNDKKTKNGKKNKKKETNNGKKPRTTTSKK
jgi:hypothetical protein